MKRVLIILLILVILPMISFAQSVREEQGSVKVYFRVSDVRLDEDYNNNGKSLNEFAEIINSCKEDKSVRIGRITIVSSTSPEGGKKLNDYLASQRAKAITDWLKKKTSAELAYTVESMTTDWAMLVSFVEKSNSVPYKQEVLDILRNAPEFVKRNGKVVEYRFEMLKKLRSSEPYNWLLQNIFPKMRYAAALTTIQWELRKPLTITTASPLNFPFVGGSGSIKFEKGVADGVAPVATCKADWISSINASESSVDFAVAENYGYESRSTTINLNYEGVDYPVTINQEATPITELTVTPEPTPEPAPAPAPQPQKKPFYMAIKTNMLYDAVATPNISAEFYLGKGFTLSAGYTHAWWKVDSKNLFWRYYGIDASLRWWFGKSSRIKPLQGHHIGLNYQIMTYDFQFGNKGILAGKPGGTLFDRPSHILAVEYGYSLPIARRLNLDFAIGFGCHWGIFDEYIPIDGHDVWQATKRRMFFGPTKVEVSLVWLIGYGNYNKNKGKGAKR